MEKKVSDIKKITEKKVSDIKKINECPYLKRYLPDCRSYGAFAKQCSTRIIIDDFGESITDKEAYRLSLVNGVGASSSGGVNPACYMFPDGKYEINKDISYILRPDLSPVQIDMYLESMKAALENSDESLKHKIEQDIQFVNEIKKRTDEGSDTSTSE